jgi:hypothetical protein
MRLVVLVWLCIHNKNSSSAIAAPTAVASLCGGKLLLQIVAENSKSYLSH